MVFLCKTVLLHKILHKNAIKPVQQFAYTTGKNATDSTLIIDAMTHTEWWAAVALARTASFQSLPLLDKKGKPFVFSTPSPVLIDLHHIDRDAAGAIRSANGMPQQEDTHRFLISSLIEEAITSSQLEGAATT